MFFFYTVPQQGLGTERSGQSQAEFTKTFKYVPHFFACSQSRGFDGKVHALKWRFAGPLPGLSAAPQSNAVSYFCNRCVHACGTGPIRKATESNISFWYSSHNYYPKIWFKQVLRYTNPLLILYLFIPTRKLSKLCIKYQAFIHEEKSPWLSGLHKPKRSEVLVKQKTDIKGTGSLSEWYKWYQKLLQPKKIQGKRDGSPAGISCLSSTSFCRVLLI